MMQTVSDKQPQQKVILILGAAGQLGFEIKKSFACVGKIIAPTRSQFDLTNVTEIEALLQRVSPDLIVNAAAFTSVDLAEDTPDLAWTLNAGLVACLASYVGRQATLVRKSGVDGRHATCQLIHFSTDYVYHSNGAGKLTEQSDSTPLSVYGQTKLAGDKAIQEQLDPLLSEHETPLYHIFRISWVYSERRQNFVLTMLRLAQTHKALQIVDDQIGAPVAASQVANTALLAYLGGIPAGVYNLTCKGETSWFEFANCIFATARDIGLLVEVPEVVPVSTETYSKGKTLAARPSNSRLSIEKLERCISSAYQTEWQMPAWQVSLDSTLEMLRDLQVK